MSLVLLLTIVFLTALTLTWWWLNLARGRAWLDRPNLRSSHEVPTPLSGGVGMVVAFLMLWIWQQQEYLAVSAILVLSVLGLIDDFYRLSNRSRLCLQLLAVAALWPLLTGLPPLLLPFDVTMHGWMLAALLLLAMLWLVNLYNFMDGIDALAATEAVFVCAAIALLQMLAGFPTLDPLVLSLGAAAAGFLFFNLPPARIFMGDVGSYFLGIAITITGLLQIAQGKLSYWALPILLGTFVTDASVTLLRRFLSGAVWYHPHRSHAYQLLAVRWNSHALVVLLNLVINVAWLFPLAWWSELQPHYGLWITLLAWGPLVLAVGWTRRLYAVSS